MNLFGMVDARLTRHRRGFLIGKTALTSTVPANA